MTMNLRAILSVCTALTVFSAPAAAGSFCEGKADGTYGSPSDCGQFVYCAADGLIEATMDCPDGLLWNDFGQYCDWPEYATCELEPADTQSAYAEIDDAEPGYSLLFEESVCVGHRELTKKDLAFFDTVEEAYTGTAAYSGIVGFQYWDASDLSEEDGVEECKQLCLETEDCNSFALGNVTVQHTCFLYSADETQSAEDLPELFMTDLSRFDCYTID